jgi:hypothetical protein
MRKRRTHQGGSDPGRSRLDPEAAAAHMLRRLGATLTSEKRTSEASACGGRPEEGGHQWGGGEGRRRGDSATPPPHPGSMSPEAAAAVTSPIGDGLSGGGLEQWRTKEIRFRWRNEGAGQRWTYYLQPKTYFFRPISPFGSPRL